MRLGASSPTGSGSMPRFVNVHDPDVEVQAFRFGGSLASYFEILTAVRVARVDVNSVRYADGRLVLGERDCLPGGWVVISDGAAWLCPAGLFGEVYRPV